MTAATPPLQDHDRVFGFAIPARDSRGRVVRLGPLLDAILAASGGLDSCTVTKWLTENGVRVVCFTADIAQLDEANFDEVGTRMKACGAADYVAIPLHDMIAESGIEVIQSIR